MEYRLKYRDLPWSTAVCVLPGKIIGTFIIKPFLYIKEDPMNLIMRFAITSLFLLLVAFLMTFLLIGVDAVTGGDVGIIKAYHEYKHKSEEKARIPINKLIEEAKKEMKEAEANNEAP